MFTDSGRKLGPCFHNLQPAAACSKYVSIALGSYSTGKTEKMIKSNFRQEKHREFKNLGKYRENTGNLKIYREKFNIKKIIEKNYWMMSMK